MIQVKHQEHWADPLSLNINLKECLEKLCPKDSQRMSIYLTEANRADGLPIHSLERLNLHYEVNASRISLPDVFVYLTT